MQTKTINKPLTTLLIAVVAMLLTYLLSNTVFQVTMLLDRYLGLSRGIVIAINSVFDFIAILVAVAIVMAIMKVKFPPMALLVALLGSVVTNLIQSARFYAEIMGGFFASGSPLYFLLPYIINFVVFFLLSLILPLNRKVSAAELLAQNMQSYTSAYSGAAQPAAPRQAASEADAAADHTDASQQVPPAYTSPVENVDGLSAALLQAIRPSLKSPLTAVLCGNESLQIVNNNGTYQIEGYVNSQNSYGAMIATDFSAQAIYSNGNWIVGSVAVGVKNAKNYAKNFAVNYIAISIFVAVMGLLGYFILTMLVG